jgi:hypothetical protein
MAIRRHSTNVWGIGKSIDGSFWGTTYFWASRDLNLRAETADVETGEGGGTALLWIPQAKIKRHANKECVQVG